MPIPDSHKVEAPSLGQIDCSLQVEVNDPAGRYSPFGGMGGLIMNEFASPEATLAFVSLNARRGYDDDEDGVGAEGSGIAFARGSITFRPAASLRQRQSQGTEAQMIGMMGMYKQSSADELRELSQQSKCADTPSFQMRTPEDLSLARPSCRLQQAVYTYDKPAAAGRNFMTKSELIEAIQESEAFFRPLTDWFGGIDMHHRFVEGLNLSNCKQFVEVTWCDCRHCFCVTDL